MAIAVERRQLSRATMFRRSLFSWERFTQLAILVVVLASWQYFGERARRLLPGASHVGG